MLKYILIIATVVVLAILSYLLSEFRQEIGEKKARILSVLGDFLNTRRTMLFRIGYSIAGSGLFAIAVWMYKKYSHVVNQFVGNYFNGYVVIGLALGALLLLFIFFVVLPEMKKIAKWAGKRFHGIKMLKSKMLKNLIPKISWPTFKLGLLIYYIMICVIFIGVARIIIFVAGPGSWVRTNDLVQITFYAEVIYLLLSLKSVGPTELGALLLFGKPTTEVGSGLVMVPLGLFSLITETALTMQDQFPGNPEDVQKTDSDMLEKGKVFPIRATHAKAKKKTDDAIDNRITTEVSVISREKIKRGKFITFLTTIGSTEEMRKQIRDTVEGGVKREFARRTPAKTLQDLDVINALLKADIKRLTKKWGIEIVDVQLVDIDLGKKINKALRDVPAALLAKQKTITDKEAEGEGLRLVGEGTAKTRELFLKAEAIGAKALSEITKTEEGKVALWIETMGKGVEKANDSIIPGTELCTAVGGLKELMEGIGKGKQLAKGA